MLIRTRLLLLALLPVPVMLALAWLTVGHERRLQADADETVRLVAAAEAAHEVAAALYVERDAAARHASVESRGLETLMLGGVSEATPEGFAIITDAADAAIDHLLKSVAATGSKRAQDTVQQLVRLRAESRGAGLGSDLRAALEPYEAIIRTLGHFGDLAAADAADGAAVNGLRALSVAERMQNHLALEQVYVRHAIMTNTLSPELVRAFVANQGEFERRRYELEEVFGDADVRQVLQAALARADSAGRASSLTTLQRFADRLDSLNTLNQALGFGGLIHDFKNYVLRGEERYRIRAEARATAAQGLLDELDAETGLSGPERIDVAELRTTVKAYTTRLQVIGESWVKRMGPAAIDRQNRFEDGPAIEALTRLSSVRLELDEAAWAQLADALNAGMDQARSILATRLSANAGAAAEYHQLRLGLSATGVAATLALLALLAWLSYRRLSYGIRVLVNEFDRVARSGDIALRQLITGKDELAQLNASVVAIGARLETLARAAEGMAEGDYSGEITPLGEQDRLARAMRAVTYSAREVVAQAQSISAGNYETVVRPRSARDTLAHALSDMATALRRFRGEVDRAQWLSDQRLAVLEALRGVDQVESLASAALNTLLPISGALAAAFYERSSTGFRVVDARGTLAERSFEGPGLVGAVAQAEWTVTLGSLPAGYLRLASGLGGTEAEAITLTPLRARGHVVGAIELGWIGEPRTATIELLDSVASSIGLALSAANARAHTETLLTETRQQAGKLQEQQLELRQSNEELEEQTQLLRQSEEELKAQREELQTSNEEMQEKSELLERQHRKLEQTARELEQATRYKSEFLANMSHELRTPLNSLLILSKQLLDNEENNLTPDQIEAAQIIHAGGRDLLTLINDILDMSKVEAGRLDIHRDTCDIGEMTGDLQRQFAPVATERKLNLTVQVDPDAPPSIVSDHQRVNQILRNLLSNALKFTPKGSVRLVVSRPPATLALRRLAGREDAVAFAVHDSGIGIAADQLERVFEAFRQGDGSTSRKYGGTGLGLTISRQLAELLGGELVAQSEVGVGSVFTLVLPQVAPESQRIGVDTPDNIRARRVPVPSTQEPPAPADSRAGLGPGECTILVVEDDSASQVAMRVLLQRERTHVLAATTGAQAMEVLRRHPVDCVVLDLTLPDTDGIEFLNRLREDQSIGHPPVVVYTGRELDQQEQRVLAELAQSIVIKGAASPDRLIDEVRFCLSEGEVRQREEKPPGPARLHSGVDAFAGRKLLLVDDDLRNIFALSGVLKKRGFQVLVADNGQLALDRLDENPDIDAVLMDVMMPVMDGIEATRRIRQQARFKNLPILAVTARAMPEDRRECLEAGASDYLSKPVDSEQLLAMLRVWLGRS